MEVSKGTKLGEMDATYTKHTGVRGTVRDGQEVILVWRQGREFGREERKCASIVLTDREHERGDRFDTAFPRERSVLPANLLQSVMSGAETRCVWYKRRKSHTENLPTVHGDRTPWA